MAKAKRSVGRPSSYREEFAEQAYKLCLLGATDREMADFFHVSEQTLNAWKGAHQEFLESLTRGKTIADAEVAHSMYRRANGYSHKAVKIFMPAGASAPVYADYTEHYPPDTAAAMNWLKNRQRDKWRDKVDHEFTGAIKTDHAYDLSQLSADELKVFLALAAKATGGDDRPGGDPQGAERAESSVVH